MPWAACARVPSNPSLTKTKVPDDPAELHQVMFQKKLTTSKDAGSFKKPKRKVDDGSAKRERRRLKRQMKRQKTARWDVHEGGPGGLARGLMRWLSLFYSRLLLEL